MRAIPLPYRTMEFRQLRYFVAAAELGNIGLAAQRLNVSQPPVSRQIQALELELGATLLVRSARGVELTEAGRVFKKEAERILAQADLAKKRSRDAHIGQIGQLDVAFFGSPVYSAVPLALRAFRRGHPNIEVRLNRMGKAEQIEALMDARIHIGFGRYFPKSAGITMELLSEEPLYAALPHDSRLSRESEVSMSDLATLPAVLFPSGDRPSFADEVLGAFRQMDLELTIDSLAADSAAALAQLSSGSGFCIVPSSIAALRFPTLAFRPIADCPITAPISCVYATDNQAPILAEFLTSLRSISFSPQPFA